MFKKVGYQEGDNFVQEPHLMIGITKADKKSSVYYQKLINDSGRYIFVLLTLSRRFYLFICQRIYQCTYTVLCHFGL